MSTTLPPKQNPPKEGKDNNKRLLIILIVLLAVTSGVLGFLLLNQTQVVEEQSTDLLELENESLALKNDLQEMLIQYDTVTVTNEKMQAEILAQQEQLRELLKQVDKHKDDAWIIHKLKKEASTLRTVMKGYLVTIDSLNTLNINLRLDRDSLNRALSSVSEEKSLLQTKTQNLEGIVAKGSVLPARDFVAEAIRVRGSGKQSSTNRADRAEMVKVCFKIGENTIAKRGKKTLFLRIISPEAMVLEDSSGEPKTFNFEGVSGVYSVKREIDYDNAEQDVCIYYTVNSELPTGQYIVELYESETKIGTTTFDLR